MTTWDLAVGVVFTGDRGAAMPRATYSKQYWASSGTGAFGSPVLKCPSAFRALRRHLAHVSASVSKADGVRARL